MADDARPGTDQPGQPPWLIALATCPSTNTWALASIAALAHGACVWTTRQTGGRGRDGNRWHSPPGVLTASFVLDLADGVGANQLSLAAGLAVVHAVDDLLGAASAARALIKWPNDCYLLDRKLAGILCERPGAGGRVVIGVGLNLDPQWDQDPGALPLAAAKTAPVSLSELIAPPTPLAVLTLLRRYLLEAAAVLAAGAWAKLLPPLRERDWLNGRRIAVKAEGRIGHGAAAGIDDDGQLLLRGDDGTVRAFASATVEPAPG